MVQKSKKDTRIIKLTSKWLINHAACSEAIKAFSAYNGDKSIIPLLMDMVQKKRLDWANWLIVRIMMYKQYVPYAIYAAEQVIAIYEHKYPNDPRPRNAIQAAKKCINHPSIKTKRVVDTAAEDAWNAVWDDFLDDYFDNAWIASNASARAAAYAAEAASKASSRAAGDAAAAAATAASAADASTSTAAWDYMLGKILLQGIKLW